VFQVLDPAECTFDFQNPSVFEDVESGRTLFIDPASARREYLRKLEDHCGRLKAICQRLGAVLHRLQTTRPLELALFEVLRQRMARGRRVQRVGRHAARSAA